MRAGALLKFLDKIVVTRPGSPKTGTSCRITADFLHALCRSQQEIGRSRNHLVSIFAVGVISVLPSSCVDTSLNQLRLLPGNVMVSGLQKAALRISDPLLRKQCNGLILGQLRRGLNWIS